MGWVLGSDSKGLVLFTVLLSLLRAFAKTEMKRVVGDNATLPCYHKLWQANPATIDIEWLLVKPNFKQTVVSRLYSHNCSAIFVLPLIIIYEFGVKLSQRQG